MCSCYIWQTDLHTEKCVGCGKTPTLYSYHLGDGKGRSITAGWCSTLCQAGYLARNPPDGGHVGLWDPSMGICHGPIWAQVAMSETKSVDPKEVDWSKTKVEVGQVWCSLGDAGRRFRIAWVNDPPDDTYCSGIQLYQDGTESDPYPFGILKSGGLPGEWAHEWYLENHGGSKKSSPKKDSSVDPDFDKAFRFFQASAHPDVCPKCAAPMPCSYH